MTYSNSSNWRWLLVWIWTCAFNVGCTTIMVDPVKAPFDEDLYGVWIGPSSRGEMWQFELNADHTGTARVVNSFDEEVETLTIRAWSLSRFDIELHVQAPRPMDTKIMRLAGTAQRDVLRLEHRSKYWAREFILLKQADSLASLDMLLGEQPAESP